jgi:Flp pilus assembly protein TadG
MRWRGDTAIGFALAIAIVLILAFAAIDGIRGYYNRESMGQAALSESRYCPFCGRKFP